MTEVIKQYAELSGIDEAECRFLVGGKPLKTDKPRAAAPRATPPLRAPPPLLWLADSTALWSGQFRSPAATAAAAPGPPWTFPKRWGRPLRRFSEIPPGPSAPSGGKSLGEASPPTRWPTPRKVPGAQGPPDY